VWGYRARDATPDGWVQVEHEEDPNVASQQIDDQRGEHIGRLQRVKALALHLNHNKTFAQSHHRCCTCDRPLNPATELAPFIRKQVCYTACAAWGCIDSSGCPVTSVAQEELMLHWQATA